MKKLVLILTLFCGLTCSVSAFASIEQLPDEFRVTGKFFAIWPTSRLSTQSGRFATVKYHPHSFSAMFVGSLSGTWTLTDTNKELIAKAVMREGGQGLYFDFFDNEDKEIGTVRHKSSFYYPIFTIRSPMGEILAMGKSNFWNSKYTIKDISGEIIATVNHQYGRNWKTRVLDQAAFAENNINPHLMMMMAGIQPYIAGYVKWFRHDDSNAKSLSSDPTVSLHASLSQDILAMVEPYRQSLEGVEPQEEDFTAIEELVESMPEFCRAEGPAEVVIEKYREDLAMLVDLLGTDALPPGQQAAMVVMLENLLGDSAE